MRPPSPRVLAALLVLAAGTVPAAWAQTAYEDAEDTARVRTVASCPVPDLGPLPAGSETDLELSADSIDLTEGALSKLLGDVRLALGGREILTSALDYDQAGRTASIAAPSRFRTAAFTLDSERASYDFATDTGVFTGTKFTLNAIGGRGVAQRFAVQKDDRLELERATFTTCEAGNDAWELSAGRIELDRTRGIGIARSTVLKLADVPVLYLPYLRYPIDGERHTGLLFPSFGNDTRVGFDTRVPIYLNLAPNYDAIVTPRYMTDRGAQLGVAGRYLLAKSQGRANLEVLPHDEVRGESRTLTEFQHEGLINRRLSTEITFAQVSDRQYFEDLSGRAAYSTLTHLERSARLTYHAPSAYTAVALVQDFQPLSTTLDGVDDPYRRLPELRFDALTLNSFLDTRLGGSAAITRFARRDSVQGFRETLHPFVRVERNVRQVQTSTQLDLVHTSYQLENTGLDEAKRPSRTLPIFSADAALPLRKRGTDSVQTLTPRLFYLYVPHRDQDSLPLFDTGEPDFDFPQLFVRNRFNGGDRVADANQLTGAVTWRMLDTARGANRVNATFGTIYRFEDSRVTLPDEPAPDAGSSDYLADASVQLTDTLSAAATITLSTEGGRFDRNAFALRYRNGLRRADLAYRYREGILEQADLSFATPIADGWRVAGRLRNSLRDEQVLDTLVGVEYDSCCWALRTSYRRTLVAGGGDYNSGVYVQLELKGLTRFGTGFDELLPGGARSTAEP